MSGLSPASYAHSFDEQVQMVLPEAVRRCPGLARRLAEAGVNVADLDSAAALDRVPVLSKDDLVELQRENPPFAELVAADAPIRRVFQSPGPLYEPELDRPDHWRWAPALRAAGFTGEDVVLNTFSYHLSPAGAMFDAAVLAVGGRVVPGGVGNLDLQVQACADLGVTAYIGLPSYLKALLERAESAGHDTHAWPLARAFVSAEPLPPSLRAWLTDRVPVVLQGYGTAETGNLGYQTKAMDGLNVPADALVQICDQTTGEAVYDGREGEVVVTIFEPDAPVVRFGTGDLSAWATDETPSAEPTPRIRGWLGRVGDAVKVRGMFLHPRQVSAVMTSVEGVEAYRFIVDRINHRDVLRCELVTETGADPELVARDVRSSVRNGLRFDIDVVPVAESTAADGPIVDSRSWE
jgi:phenylacetate-CoA ligase